MEKVLEKTLGVLVPTQMVESTLRVLRRLKLVDNRLEFSRTNEAIVIPLLRKPSDREVSIIREQCSDARLQRASFEKADLKPRDLREAVQSQVPSDLMSNLPRSFDVIGDIAVLDLPGDLNQFSSAVGKGILRLNPRLRLVLRKSSDVSGTFRTRKFEVIAGTGSTETVYTEFSCRFHLDVASVYFSPRLAHERMRIAEQVKKGECVVDMFAGVGPYSVLIAKVKPDSKLYSIELNPDAFKYLKENVLLNEVADRVIPMFGDARQSGARQLRGVANRIVMNLPSEAKNFIDVALQVLKDEGGIIHYYTFVSRDESITTIKDSFRSAIENQGRRVQSFAFARAIKEVAPNRVQVAIDAFVK